MSGFFLLIGFFLVNVVYVLIYCFFNNKDTHPMMFLGFSVYISNTTNKEDGVLCFRDTSYTRALIPNPVNLICPYSGRYVIYFNNKTHKPFLYGYSYYADADLCELEVYGEFFFNTL